MTRPVAVFGVPLYSWSEYLEPALASLRDQTLRDVAFILVDDGGDPRVEALCRRWADADERVTLVRNPRRLGMVGNWRRTFELGRELHPYAEWFAWGSDHDEWHPRWLERLLEGTAGDLTPVLVYPSSVEHGPAGTTARGWRFDTAGEQDPVRRLTAVCRGGAAGDMVYGLFRAEAMERAGIFRPVLLPDRLLLAELSVRGTFVQVPRYLWYRRRGGPATIARQRSMLFPPGRPPWHAHLPWALAHVAVFSRTVLRDPTLGARRLRARLAVAHASTVLPLAFRRRVRRMRTVHLRALAWASRRLRGALSA